MKDRGQHDRGSGSAGYASKPFSRQTGAPSKTLRRPTVVGSIEIVGERDHCVPERFGGAVLPKFSARRLVLVPVRFSAPQDPPGVRSAYAHFVPLKALGANGVVCLADALGLSALVLAPCDSAATGPF